MAFLDYLVSKFEEAEPLDPGSPGVSGSCSCSGRVACRSFLSSPSSFSGSCFQPLCLPSPRSGLRSGLALSGSGPRRAPLSFVFVLVALLAVRFAAWFLDAGVCAPFFVSEFKGHMLEDAAITFNDSGGNESEFWFAACEFDQDDYKLESLVACESDQHGDKLESLVAGCEIDQPGKFLIAGLRKTALVFSEFEGFEGKLIQKEDSRKDTSSKSSEAHSFPPHLQAQLLPELCAKTLLLLICFIGCDLAVLVALQVQAFKVGAKTLTVSGEVEDERKKEGEEKEYTEEEGKTEENLEEKRYHAFSLLDKEKEEENEE